MRTIDIVKDLLCPHHYTLISYAKRLAYTRPGSIYTDFSTYGIYAILKCTRCGLVKSEFIRQATSYQAKDILEIHKVCEKYDCWGGFVMHNESSYVTIYLISGKELNFCMGEDMRNKILEQFNDYEEDFMAIQYIEHWTPKDVIHNFVLDKASILGISWKENVK